MSESAAYTATTAFLDALLEAGVTYLFANLGSDHPALIETLAASAATGRPAPRLITCPNEMVALSCAHGYAQVSGRPQAVIVHVECGTQALAGAVHNAAKGRVPVLIYAGASPFTQEGELPGSRNEFIQWIQDVADQRGLVRGYVKYENEFRTPHHVGQLVHRALQIARSDPPGPAYLVGPREVMEAHATPAPADPAAWAPVAPAALPAEGVAAIAAAIAGAARPLVVTSYLGRKPAAVGALVALCRRHGIGVLESVPNHVNVPHDDPLYQGNQWNHPAQSPALASADVVLVIDSDVPWIPTVSRPAAGATVLHIDIDPLKERMPLWHIHAQASFRADAATALAQLAEAVPAPPDAVLAARRAHWTALSAARTARLAAREAPAATLTPEYVIARLRRHLDDDTLVLSEAISNYHVVLDHLRPTRAGSVIASGGGSLGWHGGAAIGAKLARPGATVVAIAGDGSFMFSVPSSAHWMARRYATPFLTVVLNNGGWKSPKLSALALHPDGFAARARDIGTGFDPAPDYGAIAAAAGGALALSARHPAELDEALAAGFRAVREDGRCAVLDVVLPPL